MEGGKRNSLRWCLFFDLMLKAEAICFLKFSRLIAEIFLKSSE